MLITRIQKGPVRGISFKLQEEERERKGTVSLIFRLIEDQYTPEISAIDPQSLENGLQVDSDTKEMLRSLGVWSGSLKFADMCSLNRCRLMLLL
jgi:small subunit ribosomal protein S17e